jgi:signal transduction histidine kinase
VAKAPTVLADLIQEVAAIMGPRAADKRIRLVQDVKEGLPVMTIDATQITQMLVNLVQNSVDAISSPGGEVKLAAHLADGGSAVQIEVKDNGCGIPPNNLPKLFTPFFTTKEPGKGTGLGLAIAYGIVKMHSGDISVQSERGKGTTFSISLPVGGETRQTN